MFINCPHCNALVATDPATDLPPPRCPRCAAALREEAAPPKADAADVGPGEASDAPPATDPLVEAIAAATSPTPAAADDAIDALARTPVPLAPDIVTATTDATQQAGEAQASPDDKAAGNHEAAPDDTRGTVLRDGTTTMTPDPQAAPAPDPADIGNGDSEQSATEALASADPAAEAGSPDTATSEARATPVPAPTQSAKAIPGFARVRAPIAAASGRRRWLLPASIAGLSLLLALQWVLADRARLAADARWRPFVAQLCGVLRCSLPPWREPSAFALLDRDVRPHPSLPGVLRASATFRNDARWPQPWPEVVLTLSDVEGRTVGARAFTADEYLGAAPTQNGLASGQTATIRIDVLEPAPRIVAFVFDFR